MFHFPRLSPAIIVLVEHEKELLLARSRHFPPGLYSVIAGFVEPGETLEETVVREIHEEVGIDAVPHELNPSARQEFLLDHDFLKASVIAAHVCTAFLSISGSRGSRASS